jgi:hypothetical protein
VSDTVGIGNSGPEPAYTWRVASDRATPGYPASSPADNNYVTVTTGGTVIVDEVAAPGQRRQIQLQNLSETIPVHINLGASAATTNHYRIDPGATYMFPYGVSYDGKIRGLAVGGSAVIAIIEFYNE